MSDLMGETSPMPQSITMAQMLGLYRAGRRDFSHLDFQDAWMGGVELLGIDLSQANLVSANLSQAKLEGAQLGGCNLWRANLEDADLTEVNLARAVLIRADLSRARLLRADLRCSDLRLATLHQGVLREMGPVEQLLRADDRQQIELSAPTPEVLAALSGREQAA